MPCGGGVFLVTCVRFEIQYESGGRYIDYRQCEVSSKPEQSWIGKCPNKKGEQRTKSYGDEIKHPVAIQDECEGIEGTTSVLNNHCVDGQAEKDCFENNAG